MKRLLLSLFIISAASFTWSCKKVEKERPFPERENLYLTQVSAADAIRLEQIAAYERDSLRRLDSARALFGGVTDVNSLFSKKNLMVAVVEANDHKFANVLCYKDKNGKYMFDLAFPFSANINIDPSTGKETVNYNSQQQAMIKLGVLSDVMKSGMPVGLSLLGNHDAAGFENFQSKEDATAFALIVAKEVREKGYSAVLTDDEYSNAASSKAVVGSYVMVMSEIKRLLPNTFLCYYDFGGGYTPYDKKKMGDVADVAFTPYYPQYPDGLVSASFGFTKDQALGSCSETAGGFSNAEDKMKTLKDEGYRGMMFYNVWGTSTSVAFYKPYFKALKDAELVTEAGCLDAGQYSGINGK